MRISLSIVVFAGVMLAGCQQGQAGDTTDAQAKLPAAPFVEPIDPVTDPIGATKARKQQMSIEADASKLRQEVLALIGDARADNIQQCRVVGFGDKPCGGPARYIAVSVKDVDEAELMALISRYNAASREENQRKGLMSDCAVVPKPSVMLQDGMCKLDFNGSGDAF